jgi:hypothetical protein
VRALSHPVQPQATVGAINVIVADFNVDRGMELDSRHLRTREQAPDVNIVDSVAGDHAENWTQAANDSRLLAVGNCVSLNQVGTNGFLGPSDLRSPLNGLYITFGGVLRGVIKLIAVFPQRDAGTRGMADGIVFDDPAFAPMGTDNPDLLRRWRSPGRCRLAQNEPANRDVVDARLVGIKDRLPNIDLR